MGGNNIYILLPFNFLFRPNQANLKWKSLSKNYWNYFDSEKTIANTIDIATFLSMQ